MRLYTPSRRWMRLLMLQRTLRDCCCLLFHVFFSYKILKRPILMHPSAGTAGMTNGHRAMIPTAYPDHEALRPEVISLAARYHDWHRPALESTDSDQNTVKARSRGCVPARSPFRAPLPSTSVPC